MLVVLFLMDSPAAMTYLELQSREIAKISKWENRRKYVAFNL